jgi:hypothetical protein
MFVKAAYLVSGRHGICKMNIYKFYYMLPVLFFEMQMEKDCNDVPANLHTATSFWPARRSVRKYIWHELDRHVKDNWSNWEVSYSNGVVKYMIRSLANLLCELSQARAYIKALVTGYRTGYPNAVTSPKQCHNVQRKATRLRWPRSI